MGQAPEHDPAQSSGQPLLLGLRRSLYSLALRLLWPVANPRLLHCNGFRGIGVVCSSHNFRILHGSAVPERVLLHRCASWWFNVHPRHILLPRAPPQDQRLVRRHHCFALLGTLDHSFHHQQGGMAERLLGDYRTDSALLHLSDCLYGQDSLQSPCLS